MLLSDTFYLFFPFFYTACPTRLSNSIVLATIQSHWYKREYFRTSTLFFIPSQLAAPVTCLLHSQSHVQNAQRAADLAKQLLPHMELHILKYVQLSYPLPLLLIMIIDVMRSLAVCSWEKASFAEHGK